MSQEGAQGRVALVTGGSKGIGRATAVALAGAGHRVAVGYASDQEGAEKTAAEIGGTAVHIDVTDKDSVDAAFSEIESAHGKVEILVNNAGVNADGLLARMSEEQWGRVVDTDLSGAFRTIRRAVSGMMRQRYGRIVNVASVVALSGSAGQVNYGAAKAGLVGLSRSLARELASRGITCNVVAPGPIRTAMTEALSAERQEEMTGQVPMGRMGTPEEVAAVIAFLCSDGAAYITGAVIPVDGGLGMGH
ncbi:MAG TPA: 3-oxoacyl-ACP reductase FabG [Acidimicrobiales bacterium]|nr:3-oxoacyl-ACP reductase FabG [Acidimicrobiales bacterium]